VESFVIYEKVHDFLTVLSYYILQVIQDSSVRLNVKVQLYSKSHPADSSVRLKIIKWRVRLKVILKSSSREFIQSADNSARHLACNLGKLKVIKVKSHPVYRVQLGLKVIQ